MSFACLAVYAGLDNAGKTTTLYQLHLGQAVVTNPTVGSNVEQVKHRNLTFEVRSALRSEGGIHIWRVGARLDSSCLHHISLPLWAV